MKFNPFEEEFGIIKSPTNPLFLKQDAYISDCGKFYKALACDCNSYDYEIRWPITNHNAEDQGDACDWDDFEVIKL